MGAMRSAPVLRNVVALEAVFLFLGLIVSLVPVQAKRLQFWGSIPTWSSAAPDRITIGLLDTTSPLAAAGLKEGDQVVAIDGKPVDEPESWSRSVDRLGPNEEAKLTVKRGDEERTVTLQGAEQPVEGKMYYHWQIAFAVGCVFFLITLVSTRSLSPRASMWRPMMLIMVGLVGGAVLLFANLPARYLMFTLTEAINLHSLVWQKYACVAVTFVLIALAALELRSKVSTSATYEQYASP